MPKATAKLVAKMLKRVNDDWLEHHPPRYPAQPHEIELVISYADTSVDHQGTIYKAANFQRWGKEYKQYWYHYEFWREGDRYLKKSQYIPKKMENKIIRMNNEKAPVAEILKFLKSKGKRKK